MLQSSSGPGWELRGRMVDVDVEGVAGGQGLLGDGVFGQGSGVGAASSPSGVPPLSYQASTVEAVVG